MQLISLDQLEILMLIAGSEEPLRTAYAVRRRWRYIEEVATGAQEGRVIDSNLPHVIRDCDIYAERAARIITAIDDWLLQALGGSVTETEVGPDVE